MYDRIFRALGSLLMQHRGLLWPLRKAQRSSSCILGAPTLTRPIRATGVTCQRLTPSLASYAYQKQEGNTHLVKPDPIHIGIKEHPLPWTG